MSILKHPSVKLLLKHLKNCETVTINQMQNETNSMKPSLPVWKCTLPEGSFNLSAVWVQGHILEIENCGKRVVVTDGTGQIGLLACDKVTARPEMKRGMYMMAVGTLTGSGEYPEIKPFKLQDLSHVDQAQELWHLEVRDQIHYLTSQVK